MSSQPPIEKPEAGSECGSAAWSDRAGQFHLGSAGTLADVSKMLMN
jgi:hypothetical protein